MTPQQELALADEHVVQAEGRITQQLQRIAHMKAEGQDTQLAKDVLEALEWSLQAMRAHRRVIVDGQPE
jgi:hypothetical protein